MSLVWEQRIRAFDRPVKRRMLPRFRKQQRRARWRSLRGLPSRGYSADLLFEELGLKLLPGAESPMDGAELAAARARLHFKILCSRVQERKRDAIRALQHNQRPAGRDRINLWQKRREWLAAARAP